MSSKTILIICITVASFFLGCKSSFYKASKSISRAYDDKGFAEYDFSYNHPVRLRIEKSDVINEYNRQSDTLTIVQYSNKHNGEISMLVVMNGRLFFPFTDTNQYGKTHRDYFSSKFLSAVANWDTSYINSLKEEDSFHKGIVYIARLLRGDIETLTPRSYEISK